MTTNPVALLRSVQDGDSRYDALMVWCPGCQEYDEERAFGGLHMLPVTGDNKKRPTWGWNGDLVFVTLDPSILTKTTRHDREFICQSFLKAGQWQFLGDSTHTLASRTVPMVPLPDWVIHD